MDSRGDYHPGTPEDRLWSEAFPWLTQTGQSRRLRGLLEQAEAAHRTSAASLRALGHEDRARQAERFAAWVRLELDEPEVAHRLYAVTRNLREATRLGSFLDRVLDGAMSLLGADRGNVQLVNGLTGSLRIAVQRGFGAEFLDHFAVVDDERSACGRAAASRGQAVIADVGTDPDFGPHLEVSAAAGFRAVQSTPLVDHTGRLLGVISTHHPQPYRPPDRDLWLMRRFGELAGALMADLLAASLGDRNGDPLGGAVAMLFDCQQGLARARSRSKLTRRR